MRELAARAILQTEADEVGAAVVVGRCDLAALDGGVGPAFHIVGVRAQVAPAVVIYGGRDKQRPEVARQDVDHLGCAPEGVILDVQRLRGGLGAEVSAERFHVIVVGLPCKARPRRVTHPEQHAAPSERAALHHGAVAVAAEPLGEGRIFRSAVCRAEEAGERGVESRSALRAAQCEVVDAPFVALRPQTCGREGAAHALDGHNGGHTHLGVETLGTVGEVVFRAFVLIRAVSARAVVGRGGDIGQIAADGPHIFPKGCVDVQRRIALVAPAVDGERRVAADAHDIVAGYGGEEPRVGGVRPVDGIGQPEVLPYHDAQAVGRVVEGACSGLAHPVAYHIEAHVAVVGYGVGVFPAAVGERGLAEAPAAAARGDAHTVAVELEVLEHLAGLDLADAGFVADGVAAHGERGVVEVGRAVAVGPPELHAAVEQHGVVVRAEAHLAALVRGEGDVCGETERANRALYPAALRGALVVGQHHARRHRGSCVALGERRGHHGVGEREGAVERDVDIVVDARSPAPHRRYPVPSHGGLKRRCVGSGIAAVDVG